MRTRRLVGALAASALAVGGALVAGVAPAGAARPGSYTCAGGDIPSGTYSSLLVTGECSVPDGADVLVLHDLTVAPGATFDAQSHSMVEIDGNVHAGRGSLFALGCTEAHECNSGGANENTDLVQGNVILDHVFDAAINGVHIVGNLTSNGGGAGLLDPEEQFVPFSVKDNVIDGNVNVTNLETVWFGVIRTQVGGNVLLTNIHLSDPDGNEVVANEIGGNLVCHGNDPAPQLGDAVEGAPPGYGPNAVGGQAVGQCAGLTAESA